MAENHQDADLQETSNEQASDANPQETATVEGEFKVTIRKLQMPVRPRGVLAE
jgi:hypothetical protein